MLPVPPQAKLIGLGLKILGPIAILGIAIFFINKAIDDSYDDGVDSRNAEVSQLTTERDTALADIGVLQGDLKTVRDRRDQLQADVNSLNSRIVAMSDEHSKALVQQAQQFASAQQVTSRAMDSLARNTSSNDINFAEILEQLQGVTYDYDSDTNRCVIRGGGSVLRNAAKGKIGN